MEKLDHYLMFFQNQNVHLTQQHIIDPYKKKEQNGVVKLSIPTVTSMKNVKLLVETCWEDSIFLTRLI